MELPRTFDDYPAAHDSFSEIPDERRLCNYENEISDDVWSVFLNDQYPTEISDRHQSRLNKAESSWRAICNTQNCHYALASPNEVRLWCEQLMEDMTYRSARENYLTHINRFYRYLLWNIEYPHTYNPVQFAVSESEVVAEIWNSRPWGDGNDG